MPFRIDCQSQRWFWPTGGNAGFSGFEAVPFGEMRERARGQEETARPFGERGPAVAAKRALPARPVRCRKGPRAVGPTLDLDLCELCGKVEGFARSLDPYTAFLTAIDEARVSASGRVRVHGRRQPDAGLGHRLWDPDPRVDVAAAQGAGMRGLVARRSHDQSPEAPSSSRERVLPKRPRMPPRRSFSIARM